MPAKRCLALPSATFVDPQGQKLSYKAILSNGQALPGWLTFNAATETFSGTAPAGAQTLSIVVTATDTSGLSASETISATVVGLPTVSAVTPSQTWLAGKAVSLALPSTAFIDPQGQKLSYKATLSNGQALPGWLTFSAVPRPSAFGSRHSADAQHHGHRDGQQRVVRIGNHCGYRHRHPDRYLGDGHAKLDRWQGHLVCFARQYLYRLAGQKLTYAAKLSNGQTLPSWLTFNAATDAFSGTAPATAQTLGITVTATDTSGLLVSETFQAAVIAAPSVTAATANQSWTEGKTISFALAANTFTDPQGQKLTYAAKLSNGSALPIWLIFNASTETFSGTAPATTQSQAITVTATDASGLSASESFTATVQPAASGGIAVAAATPALTWLTDRAAAFTVPAAMFTDTLGRK